MIKKNLSRQSSVAEDRIDSSDEDEYMEERQGTCYHSCHLPTHDFDCLKPLSIANLHCQSHFSSLINATFLFPSSMSLDAKPDLLHDVFPLHQTQSGDTIKKDIIIDKSKKVEEEHSHFSLDVNLPLVQVVDLKANTCKCSKIHIDQNNRRQSISSGTCTSNVDVGDGGVGGGFAAILKCHVNKSKNKRRERDRLSKSCVAQ